MSSHFNIFTHKSYTPLGIFSRGSKIGILCASFSPIRSRLFVLWSYDGIYFSDRKSTISITTKERKKESIKDCSNFQFSISIDKYVLIYRRSSEGKNYIVTATSPDAVDWKVVSEQETKAGSLALVPYYTRNGRHALYEGGLFVKLGLSKDFSDWKFANELLFTSRGGYFDSGILHLMGATLCTRGILLLYDASSRTENLHSIKVGAALFSATDPKKLLWRSESPFWKAEIEASGTKVEPLGIALLGKEIFLYWKTDKNQIIAVSIPVPFTHVRVRPKSDRVLLKRPVHNPIVSPRPHNEWESEAVFNPAAIHEDGKVHILYRALGPSGISVLGYAASKDGIVFDEREDTPAYFPRERFEGAYVKGPSTYSDLYASGGGWGGCEDPKMTVLADKIYLTYVAYNGWEPPRVAISSIDKSDFLNKKWSWDMPQLMSRPGIVDKSACLLPEKIDGKYVIFHRVFPDILIDFVDDLDFGNGKWLRNEFKISPRIGMWDSRKLSVGAPPMKTDDGWLVIYHAVDDFDDGKYKIGAMLLDKNDPRKVLYRTHQPILEPDAHYENDGKPGVAYPCGAVIKNDQLHVYYGGGDKVVCVASAPLDEFLFDLKKDIEVPFTLKPAILL